jgi:hypothetical protein
MTTRPSNYHRARNRADSIPQNFTAAMPTGCNYTHLSKIIKKINTDFLKDDIIQHIFSVSIRDTSSSFTNRFDNPTFQSHEMNSKNPLLSGMRWPNKHSLKSPSVQRSKYSIGERLMNLKPNKLLLIFITAINYEGAHAGIGIVHKHNNKIEYFVLEPYGHLFPYHEQIAEKYFRPHAIYLPFDRIQGQNSICIVHSKALLFKFLQDYKRNGNKALQKFKTSKTTFSIAPILSMGGPLGRALSGRITQSSTGNSIANSRGNTRHSKPIVKSLTSLTKRPRIKVHPGPGPKHTENVELLWLKLKARARGYLNNKFHMTGPITNEAIRVLKLNAKNTYYFQNDNKLLNRVFGISKV